MKKFTIRIIAFAVLAAATGLTLFGPKPQACAAALADKRSAQYLAEASFPVRLGACQVYEGGLAAVSNQTGLVYPAANNTNLYVIGVFAQSVDNTASSASYSATRRGVVRQGIYAFDNVQTGYDASTNAVYSLQITDVGKPCYVVDDQTVGTSSNALYSVAGTVAYVEPDLRTVWVDIAKAWTGSINALPLDLPATKTGLAKGRLFVTAYNGTNIVGIVP